MKSIIETILKNHHLLEDFQKARTFAARIQPLTPNPLEIRKVNARITVAEAVNADYWSIRGDITYSPEMRFESLPDGTWVPAYLKEPFRPGRHSVEYRDGCREVRIIRQRRQAEYARTWGERLLARDYAFGVLRFVHFE